MFTEKDLIAGETVLVLKGNPANKRLYLGCAGLVHFISAFNKYKCVGGNYTIEEMNELYFIEQQKSKVVPLEKKVYDFVPVRARNYENAKWENAFLVAVVPDLEYPFWVFTESNFYYTLRYCEFINEQ